MIFTNMKYIFIALLIHMLYTVATNTIKLSKYTLSKMSQNQNNVYTCQRTDRTGGKNII